MITRPQCSQPPTATSGKQLPSSEALRPALPYGVWLAGLLRGDTVLVQTHTGEIMPPAMVTDETPCYVFVGRLKFHRRNGWQVQRQSQRVYRMRLRLVRNKEDGQ